jgi:hypothetical protein
VTISGTGFFSPDGQVVVTFGGVVSPTRCPVEQRCTAIAPALPAGRSVPVVVRTEAGSSRPVAFSYR